MLTRSLLFALCLTLTGCGATNGVTLALQIARKALEAASELSGNAPPTSGGCQCAPMDAGADVADAASAEEGGAR